MNETDRVLVAGHRGLVGGALLRRVEQEGFKEIVVCDRDEVDLTIGARVLEYFESLRPALVFLAAARVGGIQANSRYPADFIRDNLQIQTNVIDAAWRSGAKKLCFLGSSCIYPPHARQPMKEEYLLTGPLEPTNESYAIAKIAGIKMVQAYRRQHGFKGICLQPTNLYGPGDNFALQSSHVLPALIRRFHEAKDRGESEVTIWGTGTPRREFMHVDDLADAAIFLMRNYDDKEVINVGVGKDVTISALARLVADVVGFHGAILQDAKWPDGPPRRLLDVSRLHAMGWKAKIELREGVAQTYRWFLDQDPKNLRLGGEDMARSA